MAISSETYNKDLYSLLKTKGYRPIPLDFKGEKTDPEQAVVFEFQFKKDGEKYGVSYVTVDNDVTVYYDEEQIDSPSTPSKDLDYDDTWTGFLKQLKQWAMNKQLGFDLQNKDRLGDDLAQRKYTMDKEKINEGYYPMGKTASYNDAVPTVKIILQHTRQIQEGEQRFRNVAKIFLENQLGERILAPTTRPGIAQVYARHLAEGGVPNDERWNHIKGLCEEYSKMAGFVRAVKNHQFNESAQQLVSEGVNHYTNLRETLSRMRGQRGYNTYFESWTPTLMEDESSDNTLNELFVQETLDPRIESVLPILSKLRKSVAEMKEVDELAEWADNLTEAPGAMTLKHNQDTEKSNLKAFDLEEDDDAVRAGQTARDKLKKPAFMRKAAGEKPATLGDVERSQQHRSSQAMVGQKGQELDEEGMEDTDLVIKLNKLTKAPDMFDAIYDALTSDDELGQHLQDMYFDIAREHRFHLDDDFEDIILKMADQLEHYYGEQGVAEGSDEGKTQKYEMMLSNGKVKRFTAKDDADAKRIAKGHGAKSVIKMKGDLPGNKIAEQDVAEGSEQTNESLDRLLYLANIETSKKKVDESIDDMFSLGGELPSDDKIDKVSGQDMSFDEKIRANTIQHLLQQNPSLSQDKLKELIKGKSNAELISMLREGVAEGCWGFDQWGHDTWTDAQKEVARKKKNEKQKAQRQQNKDQQNKDQQKSKQQGVAEGLNEMDKSAPQPGRDGRVSHSTYGSRDKKGSDYFQGKEALGKIITPKQMAKDALDILKKQGVGEGEFAGHYKTGPKGQLGPTEKAKNISPVIGQKEKQHPFHGKLVGNESVEYDPLDDIKKLMGK
jgi:hypothetical protein